MLQQHLAQRDHRARLAGARRHDQQRLAAVALVKARADGLDGTLLIIPPRDMLIHFDVHEAFAHLPQVKRLFQIPLGVDGGHPALRVLPVHQAGFKAVRQEDERAAALLLLDDIGI